MITDNAVTGSGRPADAPEPSVPQTDVSARGSQIREMRDPYRGQTVKQTPKRRKAKIAHA